MNKLSSKAALLAFLLDNVGVVLSSQQLQKAANGAVEFGRRLRELRAEGWCIETHRDDARLKPGQWVLRSNICGKPISFSRGISKETRARVLERNGFTCQMCGIGAGEIHPHDHRKAHLQIGHIIDKSKGGDDNMTNLRALCSICNEGIHNIKTMPPTEKELLAAIRRAGMFEQQKVFFWLKKKFESR